jgi:hypothetical protein
MNIAQYCSQAVQWILLNTVHRLFNEYCPILYTGCSMNIAQYCPQAVQLILPNTVRRLLISYSPRLSNTYSAVLNTGYLVFSGLQIKSKIFWCVPYNVQPFHIKLTIINIVQYYWCLRVPLTLCEYTGTPHLWASTTASANLFLQ